MSDCRFGVSPVNYTDPDPELEMFVVTVYIVLYMFKFTKDNKKWFVIKYSIYKVCLL